MRANAPDVNTLYKQVLRNLVDARAVAPPGIAKREVIGAPLTRSDPGPNVLVLPTRKLNHHFMVAEFIWMMCGQNHTQLIEPFNKSIMIAADEGMTSFAGAYGPKIIDQVPYVVDTLRKDPSSRQAVLTIWRERPRASKDVPCTVSMQFFVRDGALHMVTHMRSNDAWLGLPYDVFNFTMLQRYVLSMLPSVAHSLGEYHHMVGSLHLYERDVEKARALLHDTGSYRPLPSVSLFSNDASLDMPRVMAAFTELASVAPEAKKPDTRYDKTWRDAWMSRYRDLPEPWKGMLMMLTTRVWTGDIDVNNRKKLNKTWAQVLFPVYDDQGHLPLAP
jgi:thymidylate synthase